MINYRNIYKGNSFSFLMDKKQVLIVTLLIVAILFSAASIVVNMGVGDFKVSNSVSDSGVAMGKNGGNLNIEVLPRGTVP